MTRQGKTGCGPARRPRRIDEALLQRLWPTRLADKELAARHGRGHVRRVAQRLGLKPRRVIWAKEATP
jgi:hypothetical protein